MFLVCVCVLAVMAGTVTSQGLPYCTDCECRPPRDSMANLWETFTEENPANTSLRTCVCNCGKEEAEGCVRGECAYGLRCMHSMHTDTNGGNICKPLCKDPGAYRPAMHTKCVEDEEHDVALVIPRSFTCSDYEKPVDATRLLVDGHRDYLHFVNPCHMTNANAELLAENALGSLWQISFGESPMGY